jgi:glycosyltransferase involved in cell wall biosynthesis
MPTDKKLVYILNYVSTDDTQHFVHVLHLLTQLKTLGWSVVVISEKGGQGTQSILGHQVRYMSRNGGRSRLVRLAQTLRSLRKEGYRLVFVRISRPAALVAALLSRPFGWKTLYWLSGTLDDFNSRQPLVRRTVEKAILSTIFASIHRFVTGPESMVDYYKTVYRVRPGKCVLLYNDIDIDKYKPTVRGPGCRDLRVLMLHRLSPVRETSRYLPGIVAALSGYAAEQGRPVELNIVGDGPERRELEYAAAAASGGLRVAFHGAIPNRRVHEFYSRADIFIMPSYREGFPRVIIEAMAMGLPIVTTDAGGTRDLLGPQQREFVAPRDDAAAFAGKLRLLANDGGKRLELSHENRREVLRFSTEAVARMYDEALSSILAEGGSRRKESHV